MSIEDQSSVSHLTIRWAQETDAQALSELNLEFNECLRDEQAIRASLGSGDELVVIALMGDAYAGFACGQLQRSFCYDHPEVFVTELYVRAAFRRRGVAAGLLDFLEQELCRRGATHVHLETGEGNSAAQALYAKHGYHQCSHVSLRKEL